MSAIQKEMWSRKRVLLRQRVLDNFMPVTETGCWIFMGTWAKNGYGTAGVGNSNRSPALAHRFFYEQMRGPIPLGMFVCHKCDTPQCVNPDHLFIGTPRDNTQDGIRKGRIKYPIGYCFKPYKLTDSQVIEIFKDNRTHSVISTEYGIHQSMVSLIKSKKCRAGVLNQC